MSAQEDLNLYLTMLFAADVNGYVHIAYKHPNGKFAAQYPKPAWPGGRQSIVSGLLNVAQLSDCYIGPLLHRDTNGTVESALPGRTLFGEVDHALDRAQAQLLEALGAGIVASGQPGHVHVYIPLTHCLEVAQLVELNKALDVALNGGGKWFASAVLRPPGTWWRKGQWPEYDERGKRNDCYGAEPQAVRWLLAPQLEGRAPELVAQVLAVPATVGRLLAINGGQGWPDADGKVDRSGCAAAVVWAAKDAGLTLPRTKAVLRNFAPAVAKYEGRLDAEVERLWAKEGTVATKQPPKAVRGADGFNYTETGNADRLIAAHGESVRYVHWWEKWLVWDEPCWKLDPGGALVMELAKDVPRRLWAMVKDVGGKERDVLIAWAKRTESAATLGNSVRLARGMAGVLISHDVLDQDIDLLTTENGALETVTEPKFLPHNPARLVTKVAPVRYEPAATAPMFDKFVTEILPDPEVRAYVQRFLGYCLTGHVSEHVMDIWWGGGRNGKSTLLNIIHALLGPYALVAPKELLMVRNHEPHPTMFATLFRVRLASVVEIAATERFNEAQMKHLVGGDRVTARRMREDNWEFNPTHKFILACNHKPGISGTDLAVWRRIHLVPFTVTIPPEKVDPQLGAKIIADELSGVLNWCIEGCRQWRAEGLRAPRAVLAATEEYRSESDTVTQFMAESGLSYAEGARTESTEIQALHNEWCDEHGITAPEHWRKAVKAFNEAGASAGRIGNAKTRVWHGIQRDPR